MNTLEMFNLEKKRALVTGSGQGIGFELVRGLAGAGAEVILTGDIPLMSQQHTGCSPLAYYADKSFRTKQPLVESQIVVRCGW